MIKGPNIKIFKYPRKQIQSSEEINNKKVSKDEIMEGKQQKYSSTSLDLIKKEQRNINQDIDFEKRAQMNDKEGVINTIILQKNDKQTNKNINYTKINQKSISFDKKLIKMAMPDQYQKLRPVNKIENKLLSCLQKKKALIPMKKLVKSDLLNDILNKKQRKIITRRTRFTDQLELEAESLRKRSNSYRKQSEERQQDKRKKLAFQQRNKPIIKYLPTQIYQKQKEEEITQRQDKNAQIIFEPAHINPFSFLNNQDSLFENFENAFPSEPNFQQKNTTKQMGFFSSQIRKKQLFHENEREKQGQRQRGAFINNKNYFFQDPFQEKYKSQKQGFNIANIKVPKLFQEKKNAQKDERINKKFNIFSIQQENSLFFSPQKLQKSLNKNEKRKLDKQIQRNSPWESFQSENSSQYSSYY